jgi:hypothetical protein
MVTEVRYGWAVTRHRPRDGDRLRSVGLDGVLEASEPGRPELVQELLERAHAVGVDPIEAPLTIPAHAYQSRLAQRLQVQGDGLLGDVEVFCDFGDRARLIADQAQDGPSIRLGKGLQRGVGPHQQQCARVRPACTSGRLHK